MCYRKHACVHGMWKLCRAGPVQRSPRDWRPARGRAEPLPRVLCPEKQKVAAGLGVGDLSVGGGVTLSSPLGVLWTQTAGSSLTPVSARRWRRSGSWSAAACAGEDRGGPMVCWLPPAPSSGLSCGLESGLKGTAWVWVEVPTAKCSGVVGFGGVQGSGEPGQSIGV